MTTETIDYDQLFAAGLAPAAARWSGFPKHNFVGGHQDRELVPVEGLITAATLALRRKGRELATYNVDGGPQGLKELRQVVADKLERHRGTAAAIDDLLITSGSNQAIQLINQLLLERGDTVIVEEFTYQGALNDIRRRGASVVGAPLDEHGLRIDALASILDDLAARGLRPKYIYTVPTIQNPTGSVLPLERRHQLLALSRAHGVPIFEDECYADLLWAGDWPTALAGLDESNHVIHIGSFSKSLAPALRLGYVLAPWQLLGQLLALKNDGGTSALTQMVVAELFQQHSYIEHLARYRAGLKRKVEALVGALEAQFGTAAEFTPPPGGMYLWLKLPDQVDTSALERPALEAGIAFNPGAQWSVDPVAGRHHMRLCFALPTEPEIADGIARLAEVCHRETGVPERSANVARTPV